MVLRLVFTFLSISLAATGAFQSPAAVQAQLDPAVLDRVTAAVVQIAIVRDEDQLPAIEDAIATGSGTIVTPDGLILTNQHVVETVQYGGYLILILTSEGKSAPKPAYLAEIVQSDSQLDLAVLKVSTDIAGNPVPPDELELPFVELGDSDQLQYGNKLFILGYPGIGLGGLTFTEGAVSGYGWEDGLDALAWILTDGVISTGSSGGSVTNSAGQLVAIPTLGGHPACVPADTNGDGLIDLDDECRLVGGTMAQLRPVNLAKPLLLLEAYREFESETETQQSELTAPPTLTPTPTSTPITPTATPAPTNTPIPPTPTATVQPSPIPTPLPPAVLPSTEPLVLSSLLPESLALTSAQNLGVYASGATTLDELTSSFSNPGMAQQALSMFGWQEGAYRIFIVDNPDPNAAGWIELRIHRFATVGGAAEALPFLAWERQKSSELRPIGLGLFADQSSALAGPAFNGNEVSIFARRGFLIVHAFGITPSGDPTNDVIETILMPLLELATDARVVGPELLTLLPGPETLPPGLIQTEVRARSASNTADAFVNPDETRRLFQEWGWLESGSAVYTGTTSNGTTRLEAAVYRWRDDAGAGAALPYFVSSRATALALTEVAGPVMGDETRALTGTVDGGSEATIYVRSGDLLYRFTAVGPGNPMADLLYLLGAQ